MPASNTVRARLGKGAPPAMAHRGQQPTDTGGWDWPRTLIARGAEPLALHHLRRRTTEPSQGRLHCVVLDCSASMLTSGALARAKGVLIDLLQEAYQRRDHIALVCFGGSGVEVRMPPAKAGAWNDDWIAPIGGGGGTPLQLGLQRAAEVLSAHCGADAQMQGWLWLLTDARTRELPSKPVHADEIRVMDFDLGRVPLHRARVLANAWGADYLSAPN